MIIWAISVTNNSHVRFFMESIWNYLLICDYFLSAIQITSCEFVRRRYEFTKICCIDKCLRLLSEYLYSVWSWFGPIGTNTNPIAMVYRESCVRVSETAIYHYWTICAVHSECDYKKSQCMLFFSLVTLFLARTNAIRSICTESNGKSAVNIESNKKSSSFSHKRGIE